MRWGADPWTEMKRYRDDAWVLADPGTEDAHDDIVITRTAAVALRVFGLDLPSAPLDCGFAQAHIAPRWLLEVVGVVMHAIVDPGDPNDAGPGLRLISILLRRGQEDDAWASAALVAINAAPRGKALDALVTLLGEA